MDLVKIYKALSNETRLQILQWLKEPKKHFSFPGCDMGKENVDMNKVGVCVGLIQYKTGLSQSTVSHFLATLQQAGLVTATRLGQWTYYKREEANIKRFLELSGKEL
jgi:ArsR family transcriptional regulator